MKNTYNWVGGSVSYPMRNTITLYGCLQARGRCSAGLCINCGVPGLVRAGWPERGCPAEGAHQQMALPEFIATASCLSESTHVGDVLLYGQLTLIVIVCLKHSKTTVGKKKKNPHSTWMALFPPALLVYLYSKLKI